MEDKLCDSALINLIAAIENNRSDKEALRLYNEAISELESRMYELQFKEEETDEDC